MEWATQERLQLLGSILEELAAYYVLICRLDGDEAVASEAGHNGLKVAAHEVLHELYFGA